jgi:hypothetical protein
LKYSTVQRRQLRTYFRAQSCDFWVFFSYFLIVTVLNRVTKKINRAQSGSSQDASVRHEYFRKFENNSRQLSNCTQQYSICTKMFYNLRVGRSEFYAFAYIRWLIVLCAW